MNRGQCLSSRLTGRESKESSLTPTLMLCWLEIEFRVALSCGSHRIRMMTNSDTLLITSHSTMPWARAFQPTARNRVLDIPVPTKNSVSVRPAFATCDRVGAAVATLGTKVRQILARRNSPMNHGICILRCGNCPPAIASEVDFADPPRLLLFMYIATPNVTGTIHSARLSLTAVAVCRESMPNWLAAPTTL